MLEVRANCLRVRNRPENQRAGNTNGSSDIHPTVGIGNCFAHVAATQRNKRAEIEGIGTYNLGNRI
jgi:hypothetical protein